MKKTTNKKVKDGEEEFEEEMKKMKNILKQTVNKKVAEEDEEGEEEFEEEMKKMKNILKQTANKKVAEEDEEGEEEFEEEMKKRKKKEMGFKYGEGWNLSKRLMWNQKLKRKKR